MKSCFIINNRIIKELCQIKLRVFIGTWQVNFGINAVQIVGMMLSWLWSKNATTNGKSCI